MIPTIPYCDWPELLTPRDIMRIFRFGTNAVYGALRRKKIPGRFICGKWLTGKHELGIYCGIVGNDDLAREIRKLKGEVEELKKMLEMRSGSGVR